MLRWAHLTAGILSVVILSSLLIVFLRRWCCVRRPASVPIQSDSFQARISKLHQLDTSDIKRRGFPSKPGLFNWIDHPALVSEAAENGWTRFGFAVCTPGVVITWEVSNGSVDFTQTIRFNQGFREALMVLRAALPLPGPKLVSSAFPQEAYFEITILETKLFKSQGVNEQAFLSLGLATDASVSGDQTPLPGKFPASIGFQSDGSVYLDGMKLVSESEKHEWAKENKVVGCGYDPKKKKVYFTVNSHLVHVINCKAEEFGTPLYPTLVSNTEATILVNLGQSPFSYGPANGQRTPNPCFVGAGLCSSAGAAVGLEDSKELFSIGRIDSHYLTSFFTNRGNSGETASGRTTVGNSYRRKLDYDEESDADLFEIALERSCRPNPARF